MMNRGLAAALQNGRESGAKTPAGPCRKRGCLFIFDIIQDGAHTRPRDLWRADGGQAVRARAHRQQPEAADAAGIRPRRIGPAGGRRGAPLAAATVRGSEEREGASWRLVKAGGALAAA